MDKDVESIMGTNYEPKIAGNEAIGNIINKAQEMSKQFGYGDDSKVYETKF